MASPAVFIVRSRSYFLHSVSQSAKSGYTYGLIERLIDQYSKVGYALRIVRSLENLESEVRQWHNIGARVAVFDCERDWKVPALLAADIEVVNEDGIQQQIPPQLPQQQQQQQQQQWQQHENLSINAVKEHVVMFSGGSALNPTALKLRQIIPHITFVMTVSDDGGSSREIQRVIGGPSIGDIRSRLVRLARGKKCERPYLQAVRNLFNHRLASSNLKSEFAVPLDRSKLSTTATQRSLSRPLASNMTQSDINNDNDKQIQRAKTKAKEEFLSVVDGSHHLWRGIPEKFKQALRAFLHHFFHEVLRWESVLERPNIYCSSDRYMSLSGRQQLSQLPLETIEPSEKTHFDFRNGSIGNFVLTGARLFFNSLEAAIHWFSESCGLDQRSLVCPILRMNRRITIAAEIGTHGPVIFGQNNISHPPVEQAESLVDKNVAGSVPMPAKITRIKYVVDGREVEPSANPVVLEKIKNASSIVYSMGSLFTSIMPLIMARGISNSITTHCGAKVFILNGSIDRETTYYFEPNILEYDYTHHNYDESFDANFKNYCQRYQLIEHSSGMDGNRVIGKLRVLDQLEALMNAAICDEEQDQNKAKDQNNDQVDVPSFNRLERIHKMRLRRLKKYLPSFFTHVLYMEGCELIGPGDLNLLKSFGITTFAVKTASNYKLPTITDQTTDTDSKVYLRYDVDDLVDNLAKLVQTSMKSSHTVTMT